MEQRKYTDADRERDFEWFKENYDSLYEEYGHKFFTVRDKQILHANDNELTAIISTLQEYEYGEFIVQECNGDESGYTAYIN